MKLRPRTGRCWESDWKWVIRCFPLRLTYILFFRKCWLPLHLSLKFAKSLDCQYENVFYQGLIKYHRCSVYWSLSLSKFTRLFFFLTSHHFFALSGDFRDSVASSWTTTERSTSYAGFISVNCFGIHRARERLSTVLYNPPIISTRFY